ncbi:MAG: FKBP-type peptidyl-prolyl cis-trans isomerase FkpA [Porticoccaceae bacterium]|jgi:FKBP-type peptidyl-prolyl cis-trans isomerase FkpA
MKSYLFLFLSIFLFLACSSNDTNFDQQTEADIIQYLQDNNLDATKTDSGLYYVMNVEGTGATPADSSDVTIVYKGYFLDGTVFSESDSDGVSIWLSEVILGLKEGLQLFKEGGEGILLVPSNLGYGDADRGTIPGGTVLVFEIKLVEIIDYEAKNEADIIEYIEENDLVANRTNSGLYYVINEEGTGTRPTSSSNVTVAYKGYFLDGTVFDQSDANGISFGLDQVIKGWTEGIPLFKEGGEGILLIPSSLGYGLNGAGSIPRGAVLVFDVNLISVN